MTSFETCDMDDFVAQVTAQAGSLLEAASTQEILAQQVENYLQRLRAAMCADILALEVQIQGSAGVETFLELTDTPASYAGAAGDVVTVNPGETALIFSTPASGGLPDLDDNTEVSSGREFNGNPTFFKLIDIGPLPNTTTVNTAHNISPSGGFTDFVLVQAYGAATDPATNYIPLIFSTTSFATNTVYFFLDTTNVTVIAGTNRSGFTLAWVVVEYYYV